MNTFKRMKDRDFSQLAALDALDMLDEDEEKLLEMYLQDSPELENELKEFEATVTAMAYSAPPMPMADRLKERLFQRISENSENESRKIVRGGSINWQPYGVPGVRIATLDINEAANEITCLIEIDPGTTLPLHRHAGIEEVYMLRGDLVVGKDVCYTGDYIRSFPGSLHQPVSYQGCLLLVKSAIEMEIVETVNSK
jgi:hypothetical protein